jgi:hypothetical protein
MMQGGGRGRGKKASKQHQAAAAAATRGLAGGTAAFLADRAKASQRARRFADNMDEDDDIVADAGVTPAPAAWEAPAAALARLRRQRVAADDAGAPDIVPLLLEPVRGTRQRLEKSYFRLTGKVEPDDVRPPEVLRKALARLVGLLVAQSVDWKYACDQFKGAPLLCPCAGPWHAC